jgi:hypothetical protein
MSKIYSLTYFSDVEGFFGIFPTPSTFPYGKIHMVIIGPTQGTKTKMDPLITFQIAKLIINDSWAKTSLGGPLGMSHLDFPRPIKL